MRRIELSSSRAERDSWRTVRGALLIAAVAGCSAPRSRPIAEFPTRATLAAITTRSAPSPRFDAGEVPEQGWTVAAATPPSEDTPTSTTWSAHALWQPRGAWDRAVAQALHDTGRSLRLTEAMSCVARELGRWALGQNKAPPDGLRRFILGACGAVVPEVSLKNLGGDVPAEASEDAVLKHWGPQIRSQLVANLPAAATDAGFAFIRTGGRAVAVLVYAQVQAEMDPFSLYPSEAGELSFTGTLRGPADFIGGHVNQGRYGVAPCDVDPAVPPPRFQLTCKVQGDDETAWIELDYSQPQQVLAHSFARILTRRPDARQMRYQPTRHAGGQPASSTDQFAQGAVAALNEVRAQAGLTPVRLSAAQSATATRMAPYYFSATQGDDSDRTQDIIALGLMAGWDVQGVIRGGGFISTLAPQTRDPVRWLDETIELPTGRLALLAEGIEEIALGSLLLDNPPASGALVIGYRFYRSSDHRADINRLLARVQLARKQRSLAAPKRLGGLDEITQAELQQVHLGKAEPAQALQRILGAAVSRFGVNMKGYVVETTSLDAVQIPDEVLAQPTLHLEVGVTHHKPKGAAWAQLVIIVVFQDLGTVRI